MINPVVVKTAEDNFKRFAHLVCMLCGDSEDPNTNDSLSFPLLKNLLDPVIRGEGNTFSSITEFIKMKDRLVTIERDTKFFAIIPSTKPIS